MRSSKRRARPSRGIAQADPPKTRRNGPTCHIACGQWHRSCTASTDLKMKRIGNHGKKTDPREGKQGKNEETMAIQDTVIQKPTTQETRQPTTAQALEAPLSLECSQSSTWLFAFGWEGANVRSTFKCCHHKTCWIMVDPQSVNPNVKKRQMAGTPKNAHPPS